VGSGIFDRGIKFMKQQLDGQLAKASSEAAPDAERLGIPSKYAYFNLPEFLATKAAADGRFARSKANLIQNFAVDEFRKVLNSKSLKLLPIPNWTSLIYLTRLEVEPEMILHAIPYSYCTERFRKLFHFFGMSTDPGETIRTKLRSFSGPGFRKDISNSAMLDLLSNPNIRSNTDLLVLLNYIGLEESAKAFIMSEMSKILSSGNLLTTLGGISQGSSVVADIKFNADSTNNVIDNPLPPGSTLRELLNITAVQVYIDLLFSDKIFNKIRMIWSTKNVVLHESMTIEPVIGKRRIVTGKQ
jgi:hypothetical protein